jgi:hypothetical protein
VNPPERLLEQTQIAFSPSASEAGPAKNLYLKGALSPRQKICSREKGGERGKKHRYFLYCTMYGSRLHPVGYHVGRGFTPLLHAVTIMANREESRAPPSCASLPDRKSVREKKEAKGERDTAISCIAQCMGPGCTRWDIT